ncbi:hypothetical protein [Tengunoibacter tsumagoiensis]|uniref:Integrase catalytic domain-containing protein n=1 Tax=Tengunoibacter tsumagoiensis TaxID=2014871 RepID=A0A402A7F0_9CHLR|nr:hypothetical protein [Tengunoibacter tsumagoiensis]GCE14941.1 hypothetical protein KTT_48000 [Tengunoibacter tsumagoiensis]
MGKSGGECLEDGSSSSPTSSGTDPSFPSRQEYTSQTYRDVLQEHQIQIIMSRKGDFYSNVMIKSFWGTVEQEGIEERVFSMYKEAKDFIFETFS